MNSIQYFTRCNQDDLFEMCQELCPHPITKIENYNRWEDSSHYLYNIIDNAEEWAVNIDLDCFLIHPPSVDSIIGCMDASGHTHCGMPDGGVIKLRSCSWCTTQPFFNVFNAKKIRVLKENLGLTWEEIGNFRYEPEWNQRIPRMVTGNWDANKYEPFNGLFFFLFKYGSPLFLDAAEMGDGISTALIWNHRTIAYHSWYAREFGRSEIGLIRILNLYNKAKLDALMNSESDKLLSFTDPKNILR